MCGIFGVVGTEPVRPEAIDDGLAALAHRGPDGDGIYRSPPGRPPAVLGHRRLSVIDLETGSQPMESEDGTRIVVFNGEIYNYRSLRADLERSGHRFATASDTEVLVHGFEEWGESLPERLVGMFAFALFDERTGAVFLARDRFGQKPLYYAVAAGGLFFASELAALRALLPGGGLDPAALTAYLRYGYVPEPLCIDAGVRKLPPAHWMRFQPGAEPGFGRYWSLPAASRREQRLDEARCVEELDGLLATAVEDRMVADVPLGAFLSGGLDSSLIAAYMCRAQGPGAERIRTFSIGFAEKSYDESRYADRVARYLGTAHHTEKVVLDPARSLALLERLDEPFGDASFLPTACLSEITRQYVTVALSGDGADELFAGYRRYAAVRMAYRYNRLPAAVRKGLVGRVLDALPRPPGYYGDSVIARAKLFVAFADRLADDPARFSPAFFREDELRLLLGDLYLPHPDPVYEAAGADPAGEPVDRMLRADLATYLCGDILFKVDRASMYHSLEVRCPFLDHRVAEWALSVPTDLKLRGRGGKYVLRKVAGRYLPPDVLKRAKHGFMAPVDRWFRAGLGPVFEERVAACPVVRQDAALQYLAEHRAGAVDHAIKLWILLALAVVLGREGEA